MKNNLEDNIKDCISKELEKGIIEKVIAEEFEKCVRKSVSDLFKWDGAAKKAIEDKVGSVMIPVIEDYNYNEYVVKLDTVLTDVVKTLTHDNRKILSNFKTLIAQDSPRRDFNLTEIFKKWCEYCKDNIDTDVLSCSDFEGGYITINLETKKNRSFGKECVVTLTCDEDNDLSYEFEIYKAYTCDSEDNHYNLLSQKPVELSSLRNLNEFEIYMLNISHGYGNIVLDTENESTDIYVEKEY